jgi:trans-aconitate methyltransferase
VLDIGCGGGSTTEQISRAVGATGGVLGLDISEPLLSLAKSRCAGLPQVRFENSDAQVHAFSAKGFDLLFSRFGVMFFSDPPAAFMNLLGALRSNGRLHFVCWAAADKNPWFSIPLEVAKHHLGSPEPTPARAPGPLAFSEPDYVEEILTTAGFRQIEIETAATTMTSPDSPEQQAELYLKMGPASRFVSAMSPDAQTMTALTRDLVSELRRYETEAGIALGATVHYVAATA